MNEYDRDDIIDLCYIPKYHQDVIPEICQDVKRHMLSRIQTRKSFEKIVSCYQIRKWPYTFWSHRECLLLSYNSRPFLKTICSLLFPLWILPALILKNQTLTILQVTVAYFPGFSTSHLSYRENKNEGKLFINQLTVVTDMAELDDATLQISLNECSIVCKEICLLRYDDPKLLQKLNCVQNISHHGSPHIMFGSCCGISNFYQPPTKSGGFFAGDRILIATLGYGYNKYPFLDDDKCDKRCIDIHHEMILDDQSASIYEYWLTCPWIIHDYTKTSSFVICKTTDVNGIIINGATAKALQKLRKKWVNWKKEKDKNGKIKFKNLVVLIPYGGQYMKDEMEEIYEATKEGIIIVCAAGKEGGDVVFPAALGTVISVGVAGTGPKGREIDVSINFSKQPAKLLNSAEDVVELPKDCGIAAAIVVGLLSLLLSHINSIMHEPEAYLDDDMQEKAKDLKELGRSFYLHTYVIRELIVNAGNGSHDPQLGYGDGEEIISSLLDMDPNILFEKLAYVILADPPKQQFQQTCKRPLECRPISDEDRKRRFFDLKGSNIHVGIIDRFDSTTNFMHGEKCAMILQNISSECELSRLNISNSDTDALRKTFAEVCNSEEISVISCSVSSPCFNLHLCTEVDKAVKAGKIIVFAAGNTGFGQQNSIEYPGRIGNIIVVGRCDEFSKPADYNPAGREMDFLAQAEFVKKSSLHKGTSYAAPVVAAYIALLLQFIKEEMADYEIEAWSGENWQKISAFEAAQNVYAMRTLLKLLISKQVDSHSEEEGYGCLDFSMLSPRFRVLTEDSDKKKFKTNPATRKIHGALKKFYKRL